jgi:hypothetical protein
MSIMWRGYFRNDDPTECNAVPMSTVWLLSMATLMAEYLNDVSAILLSTVRPFGGAAVVLFTLVAIHYVMGLAELRFYDAEQRRSGNPVVSGFLKLLIFVFGLGLIWLVLAFLIFI